MLRKSYIAGLLFSRCFYITLALRSPGKDLSILLNISYVSLSTISDIKSSGCDLSSVQRDWGKRKMMAGMKTCVLAHFLDLSTFLNDLLNANILFSPSLLNFGDEFSRKVSEKPINK